MEDITNEKNDFRIGDTEFRTNARALEKRHESHRREAVTAEIGTTLAQVASGGNVRKLGTGG